MIGGALNYLRDLLNNDELELAVFILVLVKPICETYLFEVNRTISLPIPY